jgi:hypothetical protein
MRKVRDTWLLVYRGSCKQQELQVEKTSKSQACKALTRLPSAVMKEGVHQLYGCSPSQAKPSQATRAALITSVSFLLGPFLCQWGCPSEAGDWMAMTGDCKYKTPFNKSVPIWYVNMYMFTHVCLQAASFKAFPS